MYDVTSQSLDSWSNFWGAVHFYMLFYFVTLPLTNFFMDIKSRLVLIQDGFLLLK